MVQAIYNARLGVIAQQKRVDIIANNISNINTYGFRGSTINFKDMLYFSMRNPAGVQNTNLQRGSGVAVASTGRSFREGIPMATGVSLDFCLQGDGFFTVMDSAGNKQYTRCGCFAVSSEPGGKYLVNAQGKYVLDNEGKKIKLPDDIDDLTVSENGALSIGEEEPFATLNIASFENNEGLEAVAGECFIPTDASGPAETAEGAKVKQGFLEGSNVDMTVEMTKLIRAQRALSLAGKALTTVDEMDSAANNLRT